MNIIKKILRRDEIKQCEKDEININFSQKQYNKRKLPTLYFTKNYTINNSVLFIKGDEYDPYLWNYSRLVSLLRRGILCQHKPIPIVISDLIDVIHFTLIKKEGTNTILLDELKSIDEKIHNGTLKNYDVGEITFWKSIINSIKRI